MWSRSLDLKVLFIAVWSLALVGFEGLIVTAEAEVTDLQCEMHDLGTLGGDYSRAHRY